MHKARKAMESSSNNPMNENVRVDEFVMNGQEREKVGRSYNVKKKNCLDRRANQ